MKLLAPTKVYTTMAHLIPAAGFRVHSNLLHIAALVYAPVANRPLGVGQVKVFLVLRESVVIDSAVIVVLSRDVNKLTFLLGVDDRSRVAIGPAKNSRPISDVWHLH